MKILITGGSGFIGKNLIDYLSKDHEVLAPRHKELELMDESAVSAFFAKNKIDVVIHAANFGGNRKQGDYKDVVKKNLKIFFNLAGNSHRYRRMIFFGSGAEYDHKKDVVNVTESDFGKRVPEEDYGFYKYVCSKYIAKSDNIINLRLFGVFGRYEDPDIRFISNIMCRAMFDLPVEVNQNRLMDYVDVRDLCRIVEHFLNNSAKSKFYNIGASAHLDLLTIARKIRDISGKGFEMEVKKKGMDREYTCDNSALMKELGDFRFTDIDKSLQDLWEWYLENKANIKKEGLLAY
ncbi:NAD(P)-dependent oxidoreductase [Candidatus Woesearchaeota archaeon]|nr:NAD(P)-dependent oxidoreductase [Candidatus Woesearchaeota archaeon]